MDALPDILLTVAIAVVAGALGALAIRVWERPGRAQPPATRRPPSALYGVAPNEEILIAVASMAPPAMVARDDVLAVAELSSIVYAADAQPRVTPGGSVQDSIGRRTEFCVGDPRSNPRMAAHLTRYLPGVSFSPPVPPPPPTAAPAPTAATSTPAATTGPTTPTPTTATPVPATVGDAAAPATAALPRPRESRVIVVTLPASKEHRRLRGDKEHGGTITREFAGRPGEHEFALLARIAGSPARRPLFIIAGQTATANLAAAYYLRSRGEELAREFAGKPSFCLVLRVDAASVYGHELVEREADISAVITPPPV